MKTPRKRTARAGTDTGSVVSRGRKSLADLGMEAVSAQTTVNFRPSVLRRVDRLALAVGMLRSDMLRKLTEEALVRAEAAVDPAELARADRQLNRKAKAAAQPAK